MSEHLRRCSKCNEHKQLDQFGVHKQRKDGISLWCKPCVNTSIKALRSTSKGRTAHNEREKARHRADPMVGRKKAKGWRDANLERAKASNNAAAKRRMVCPVYRLWESVRQTDWGRRNPSIVIANTNRRRAAKIGATPKWLTAIQKSQVQQFYDISVACQAQTGVRYTVDHIHPLRGNNFSGLHVPWNLQIMSHSKNSSKANNIEPEHAPAFFMAA